MKRTKEDALQTRETILKTALIMFDEYGYSQTSLNQIACEMNVTRGAIYGHFANKADILSTLSEQFFLTFWTQFDVSLRSENIWREIELMFVRFFTELVQHSDLQRFFRIVHIQKQTDPIFAKLEKHNRLRWEEKFQHALTISRSQKLLAPNVDDEYLIFHFHVVITGLIHICLKKTTSKNAKNLLMLCQQTLANTINFFIVSNTSLTE